MSNRFRRLTDLFVRGKAVELPAAPDGTPSGHLWVQVINSYERDEALSDAAVARSKLILALRDEGDERLKVEARLAERGRDSMIRELAELRVQTKTGDFAEEMRADPEWKDRVEIVLRQDEESQARPDSPEEAALVNKINAEVLEELARREDLEREFLIRKFTRMSDGEFVDEWIEEWIERRGAARAGAEYRLTEVWYATRWCEAVTTEDGDLDHGRCDGHRSRVFPSKADARAADDGLVDLIKIALAELNLVGLDPKDSASAANSSDSPPTPSEPGESMPSTSTETPEPVPGTSASPSPTP